MKHLIAAILLFLTSAAASADIPVTGNTVHSACTAGEGTLMDAFCVGYVAGVVEGMNWGAALPAFMIGQDADEANSFIAATLGFCTPNEANWQQVIDVVVQFLESNPSERHLPARGLIQSAMVEAFPC